MNNQQPKSKKPKLLDQLRHRIRSKHYSIRTEDVYVDWVRRFILFHDKQHLACMGAAEIEAFLTHLAIARKVSASTQNQARSALLFLYNHYRHGRGLVCPGFGILVAFGQYQVLLGYFTGKAAIDLVSSLLDIDCFKDSPVQFFFPCPILFSLMPMFTH